MGEEDVRITVEVEIAGGDSHARLGHTARVVGGAGEQRNILECPVALIEPKLVGVPVIGDVDIRPAVAVEVRAHHPEPAAKSEIDPRLDRRITKGAVAVVRKQAVRNRVE